MTWNDQHEYLLKNYSRPVVHMRSQCKEHKLGLMFGAGVSKDLAIPNWDDLVKRIAKITGGEALIASPEQRWSITQKIQLLFEDYRRKRADAEEADGATTCPSPLMDPRTKKWWHQKIWEALYQELKIKDDQRVADIHPYLGAYAKVILESRMTINYNFDDFIERMLADINRQNGKAVGEGYESVWDINLQFKSNAVVIYHPNGFLPKDLLERRSDWLVFSEDEYADQLIHSMTGYFSSLAHHLSKNTCLLIGLSLDDSTLRHLLRQNAIINPGHYHYYVAYVDDASKRPSAEEIRTITAANFEVYNLITLFLTKDEVKALGELISAPPKEFVHESTQHEHIVKYCYYVSGAIGAGKSTVISYFRSLQAHDEWTEARPPVLAKYADDLTPQDREVADRWIADQFVKKNSELCMSNEGIHIIDRSPLDPLGFSDYTEWDEKAKSLHKEVSKGRRKIEPGKVVLLTNNPSILKTRIKPSQEEHTEERLEKQQDRLVNAYSLPEGVELLDAAGLNVSEVVKCVARIVHLDAYEPTAQLQQRLQKIAKGG